METQNLEAASTYINNLLLARGLLKNGKPIDFAQPDNSDEGSDATMARIINLVNDLVVRRDVSLAANRCESMLTKDSARPNIAKTWLARYGICELQNRSKWMILYWLLR